MTRSIIAPVTVCALIGLLLFAGICLNILVFPYAVDYGEGPLLDQAARIIAGERLYKPDLDRPPYVITNYPPLYPALMAVGSSVSGWPLLMVGRIISLLATLLSGLIIGLLAHRLTGSSPAGLLAAAFFLCNPIVLYWGPLARVDMLALGLSLLGLWLVLTRWHCWPWLALASLALLAAFFTRQTYALAAPLASVVWLWRNERRRSLAFGLGLAGLALAGALLLDSISGGGYLQNTVTANVNRFSLRRTLMLAGNTLMIWPLVPALAGLQMLHVLDERSERRPTTSSDPGQMVLLYGLLPYTVAALASSIAIGKIGSNLNYFLEFIAALSVWAGISLVWLPQWRRLPTRIASWPVMAPAIWAVFIAVLLYASTVAPLRLALAEYEDLASEIAAAASQGQVLADRNMDMIVRAGQRLYLQPFEYRQLYDAGLWDPAPLTEEIAARRFSLIAIESPGSDLSAERWPPPVVAAIAAYYTPTTQIKNIVLYEPQP